MIKSYGLWAIVCSVFALTASGQSFTELGIVSQGLKAGDANKSASSGQSSGTNRPAAAISRQSRTTSQASATGTGIVYTCDAKVSAAVCGALNTTIANLYSAAFTNANATIYIRFGAVTGFLAQGSFPTFGTSYASYRAALQPSLSSVDDNTAFAASVPAASPLPGPATVGLTAPLLRTLGFVPANTALPGIAADLTSCATNGSPGCYDAVITFPQSFQDAGEFYYRTGSVQDDQIDFYTVVEFETNLVLGDLSCAFGCTGGFYPQDLYRYQGNGARSFAPGNNTSCYTAGTTGNACFSLDGSQMIQQFNNITTLGPAGGWIPNCAVGLVQNAETCFGFSDIDISPAAEIRLLDVIGYTRAATSFTPVQAYTSSTLTAPGSCVAPPAVSQFTTASAVVSIFGSVTGARVGEGAVIFLVRPDGLYYDTTLPLFAPILSTGPNGAACFSASFPVAMQAAAAFPGDWTALIYWISGDTESETVLFSVHFSLRGQACTYSFGSAGQAIEPLGGQGVLSIVTPSGCPWALVGVPNWVALLRIPAGIGSANMPFTVPANAGSYRSGTVTLAGNNFTFEQGALSPPGLAAVGSLAEVTTQAASNFTFTAANLGSTSTTARFSFLTDGGVPLPLPLAFPQTSSSTPLVGSTLDRTIAANAQLVIQSPGTAATGVVTGWAQLLSTGKVNGFGMFSYPLLRWNAAVPLEARNAAKYTLAFDNTTSGANPLATGVAVANLSSAWADIPVVLRDDTGLLLATATVSLPSQGHTSFMLNQQYPATAARRGTIEFDTPSYSDLSGTHAGQISVLGLRTNGSALTTLPVLADGDAPGGAIAHVTYNGGFTSTFHLVNTGTATASFTLSFFDAKGGALSVPLLLPQSGASVTTSALTQTLAPGAMLVAQTPSNDAAPNVSGSAQLTTTGSVGGFEIFNWTAFGQEATVPLETRTPSSFVLLFDNTSSQTTGVALSNASSTAASVTVKIYSDTGLLLRTATLNLSANGHGSFLLPTMYTQAAGRRGMAEFVVPQGGKIGAIGLRATPTGSLTTIPMLVR